MSFQDSNTFVPKKVLYDQNTIKTTNFRRARRTNWKKAISILLKKGMVDEAKRYQEHVNILLSAFHDHITANNTKIQVFRPIDDVDKISRL